jgi:hypothetical protein
LAATGESHGLGNASAAAAESADSRRPAACPFRRPCGPRRR